MKNFLKRLSLRSIIMIFCSSFILLVILVSAVFYFTGVRHMNGLVKQNASNLTVQATRNMERKLEQLRQSSKQTITDSYRFLKMNKNIQENAEPISTKNYAELARGIQTFVNQNSQDISVVILMLSDNSIVLNASYYDESYRCRQPDYDGLYARYSDRQLDWIYGDSASEFIGNSKVLPKIGLIQMLGSETSDIHGFVYVGLTDYSVLKELNSYHVTNNNIFALAQGGKILFQDSGYFMQDTYARLTEDDFRQIKRNVLKSGNQSVSALHLSGNYVLCSPMEAMPLEVVAMIPEDEMFIDSHKFSTLILAEGVGAILLCCLLFAAVTKLISAPAERLARQLNSVENLTQLEAVQATGGKDFAQITEAINHLYRWIQNLISSLTSEIQSRKDAELKIFYAQINPHFLYNTLDSIGQLCEMNETGSAHRMVRELSDFYRIGVSKGENLIPLREELLHVTSYLSILRTRFEDFEFHIDVPDQLKDVYVPKIILQPLAENAVYHGIRGVNAGGAITITGRALDGDLLLRVADDGNGMDDEVLSGIRASLLDSGPSGETQVKVYGLKNVHQRIVLQFGERYGVSVESEPEEGTTVEIRLPLLTKLQGGHGECQKYYL